MNNRAKCVGFKNAGKIQYQQGWDLQKELFDTIISQKIELRKNPKKDVYPPNYLLFCEHSPVYTLGKSGKFENLLLTKDQLIEKNIDYYHINRGGDITFHGPGQIVGYPIIDLDQFFTDIHKYLRFLEEAVILTLAEYGIISERLPGFTGVWIDGNNPLRARKICAIGIKCSHWVTMHGFAFNVNTDLSYFDNIIPCGIDDKSVTSMQKELGVELDLNEVTEKLQDHLTNLFGWELIF